ncbi:MAG: hypothetical protein WCL32_23020, partial [Planctomycetota bacterium]
MSASLDQLRDQFQAELDAVHDGETLDLDMPRERPGLVVLRKAITLDGHGITIWAMKGPVLRIDADRVSLRNLRIELTGEASSPASADGCAIEVRGKRATLENVEVRGRVMGLPEEEGLWAYPNSLNLGELPYGTDHHVHLRVVVPVPCQLTSEIAGIAIEPRNLSPGPHEVTVRLDRLSPDTLLSGTFSLRTAFLKRRIHVSGFTSRIGNPIVAREIDKVIWSPPDWGRPPVEVRPKSNPPPPPTRQEPECPKLPERPKKRSPNYPLSSDEVELPSGVPPTRPKSWEEPPVAPSPVPPIGSPQTEPPVLPVRITEQRKRPSGPL